MRIVVFGSSGKLGTGLVEGLQYSGFSEIYSPLRNEVNLSISGEVENYLKKVQPNVVINSAGLTTNQDSARLKQIQVFNYNSLLSQNVFNVLKKFTDCVYIEIGSASIYESFPTEKISELNFNQIHEYYPKIEYSKSKVTQSIEIFNAAKNGSNMYSLILPYVIYTSTKPMNNPGLFNRISESIIDARNNDKDFKLDPKQNRLISPSLRCSFSRKWWSDDSQFQGKWSYNGALGFSPKQIKLNFPFQNLATLVDFQRSVVPSFEYRQLNY